MTEHPLLFCRTCKAPMYLTDRGFRYLVPYLPNRTFMVSDGHSCQLHRTYLREAASEK